MANTKTEGNRCVLDFCLNMEKNYPNNLKLCFILSYSRTEDPDLKTNFEYYFVRMALSVASYGIILILRPHVDSRLVAPKEQFQRQIEEVELAY